MNCSCEGYDIFNYMEIGFCSLLLILLICLIINEIFYARKINRIEKDVEDLKTILFKINDWSLKNERNN